MLELSLLFDNAWGLHSRPRYDL